MERFKRASVMGIATAAVLAGSVGVAMAVVDPSPPTPPASEPVTARPALTARATVGSIGAWQQFRVYGTAEHLAPGTKVTLQQKQGKQWVSLPASMHTTHRSTYRMRVYLGLKGQNKLRMVGGGTTSEHVTVVVH
ncbi:hypothetical protein SLUN_32805 [Streptomyces lunaelactis]|uniref:Secreted protein n=1 Tax=Streptomyces lunaelactis TaxID=1535768 RepID=A0A2R4TAX6_9ACTN|nr:hypothetical protein [Streptomyces lunaelactis]AVZ76278.1 hypothetical protein SLUN_32805 [Streptomyces lunaelactis]NUK88323.1 hypothetical protein [Streptomyces lunaelactis]NUL06925.1 hypothetical protein [Streptomyces lunaelactis]